MSVEPSITQLRNFILVAEHRSFQAAADEAYRSQPGMSKSIQALEASLGQALFERSRRHTLTPYGESCLPLAQEALRHYERAMQAMVSMADSASGSVAVASIGGIASSWLPRIVEAFISAHPGIALRLLDDNTENIARMVATGEVDFGLCSDIGSPGLQFEPLARDDFGLVCRPDHPLVRRSRLTWSDLDGLRLISTTAHRLLGDTPQRALLSQRPLEVGNMMTLLSMLERGVAQTVLPRLAIPDMLRGSLAFVRLEEPRRSREVGILRIAGRSFSPAARVMADQIASFVRELDDDSVSSGPAP